MKKIQVGGHIKRFGVRSRVSYALVDDDDYEWLNQWKWSRYGCGYAVRKGTKGETIFMHRLIMKTPQGMETDHIDHNRLNNQKSNLRICTRKQNAANLPISKANKSGFKGVFFSKNHNKWTAYVIRNRKQYYLGMFDDPKDAARAYNEKARQLHGNFAYLNETE